MGRGTRARVLHLPAVCVRGRHRPRDGQVLHQQRRRQDNRAQQHVQAGELPRGRGKACHEAARVQARHSSERRAVHVAGCHGVGEHPRRGEPRDVLPAARGEQLHWRPRHHALLPPVDRDQPEALGAPREEGDLRAPDEGPRADPGERRRGHEEEGVLAHVGALRPPPPRRAPPLPGPAPLQQGAPPAQARLPGRLHLFGKPGNARRLPEGAVLRRREAGQDGGVPPGGGAPGVRGLRVYRVQERQVHDPAVPAGADALRGARHPRGRVGRHGPEPRGGGARRGRAAAVRRGEGALHGHEPPRQALPAVQGRRDPRRRRHLPRVGQVGPALRRRADHRRPVQPRRRRERARDRRGPQEDEDRHAEAAGRGDHQVRHLRGDPAQGRGAGPPDPGGVRGLGGALRRGAGQVLPGGGLHGPPPREGGGDGQAVPLAGRQLGGLPERAVCLTLEPFFPVRQRQGPDIFRGRREGRPFS
mmetsp:Transcript_115218/g.326454  ORF Transcript_115218/g.326454 Transcript_115218/m.326454 type:complete len:474 (+) Transcript_115218:210-1631(+)